MPRMASAREEGGSSQQVRVRVRPRQHWIGGGLVEGLKTAGWTQWGGEGNEVPLASRSGVRVSEAFVSLVSVCDVHVCSLDLDDPRVQDCLDRLARGEALPDDEVPHTDTQSRHTRHMTHDTHHTYMAYRGRQGSHDKADG